MQLESTKTILTDSQRHVFERWHSVKKSFAKLFSARKQEKSLYQMVQHIIDTTENHEKMTSRLPNTVDSSWDGRIYINALQIVVQHILNRGHDKEVQTSNALIVDPFWYSDKPLYYRTRRGTIQEVKIKSG